MPTPVPAASQPAAPAQYTPGPWVVADDHPSGSCLYVREARRPTHAYDVAVLWAPFDGGRAARAANARLIASAPELLEALRLALEVADWNTERGHPGRLIALAAIAKATQP